MTNELTLGGLWPCSKCQRLTLVVNPTRETVFPRFDHDEAGAIFNGGAPF